MFPEIITKQVLEERSHISDEQLEQVIEDMDATAAAFEKAALTAEIVGNRIDADAKREQASFHRQGSVFFRRLQAARASL